MATAPPTLDLTKLSPAELARLQRALVTLMQQSLPADVIDYSKEPSIMVSHHTDTPNAYRVEGEYLVDANDKRYGPTEHKGFAVDPVDQAVRIGHAPVAINGIVVESLEHHVGLRMGDAATLAKYNTPAAEVSTLAEADASDGTSSDANVDENEKFLNKPHTNGGKQ